MSYKLTMLSLAGNKLISSKTTTLSSSNRLICMLGASQWNSALYYNPGCQARLK